jgi:hypothetical protein
MAGRLSKSVSSFKFRVSKKLKPEHDQLGGTLGTRKRQRGPGSKHPVNGATAKSRSTPKIGRIAFVAARQIAREETTCFPQVMEP